MEEDTTLRLEASLVRLRVRQPFFGALALFIDYHIDDSIPTACTNGRWIRFNPKFTASINSAELDGVMIHELLHAALRHSERRGEREPKIWNIAADIVINGMIREINGLKLPFKPVEDYRLKDLEVEEVYDQLIEYNYTYRLSSDWRDLATDGAGDADSDSSSQSGKHHSSDQETFWASAFSRARMLAGSEDYGKLPAGLRRRVGEILEPSLDWRTILWRFLSRSPVDFEGFDRRFIGSGLYLEDLQGETLNVRVCIDTSGSIGPETLAQFLAELSAIVAAYPHLTVLVYYADTDLYGPWELGEQEAFKPVGGGGTDFRPFFREMDKPDHDDALLIYFTDGYGTLPDRAQQQELLWILNPEGSKEGLQEMGEICFVEKMVNCGGLEEVKNF
ncbi:VWA-like domain-containing protein [Verrucomicrobia bacterium]|nr:VWA-like domain-containing protein [Verrucomicrobiota bacterium]